MSIYEHIDNSFCAVSKAKIYKFTCDEDNKYPYYKVLVDNERLLPDSSLCVRSAYTLRIEIHSPKQQDCRIDDALVSNRESLDQYKSAIVAVLRALKTHYGYTLDANSFIDVRSNASGVTEDCHIVTRVTATLTGGRIKNYHPSSSWDLDKLIGKKEIAAWKR